ncbi:hypothetical protein ES707_08610 [subsurface metagenome]
MTADVQRELGVEVRRVVSDDRQLKLGAVAGNIAELVSEEIEGIIGGVPKRCRDKERQTGRDSEAPIAARRSERCYRDLQLGRQGIAG